LGGNQLERERSGRREGRAELKGSEVKEIRRVEAGGHKPNYDMLHILECACYPLLRPYTRHKLEARSEKCVFLGYSTTHKGYCCLHQQSNQIYFSRHVTFDEKDFPFKTQQLVHSIASPP
jgi:hypothetical protein